MPANQTGNKYICYAVEKFCRSKTIAILNISHVLTFGHGTNHRNRNESVLFSLILPDNLFIQFYVQAYFK